MAYKIPIHKKVKWPITHKMGELAAGRSPSSSTPISSAFLNYLKKNIIKTHNRIFGTIINNTRRIDMNI